MKDTEQEIMELLAAVLCGEELSEEEKNRLEIWKNATPANRRKQEYYEHLFNRREELRLWEQINTKTISSGKLFYRKQLWHRRNLTILKYAAVILPFAGILLWLLWQNPKEQQIFTSTDTIVQNDIAPGKQKARLLLENGETIALSDSSISIRTHRDIQVNKGGIVQYASNNSLSQRKAVYHKLVVDRGGEFQLVLPDGTKVWLNADSELRYPDIFNDSTRKVYLKGEAYFDVKHSEKQPFIVSVEDCDIRVLGTEFNISCYDGGSHVITTLVEGKVAYRTGKLQGELKPGWQCVYDTEKKSADVKKVEVDKYISWKNGLFIFDGVKMEELAKQVERWYNVNVIFADHFVRDSRFTGAMERYKPVSYLISMLNETNTVECRLENNILVFRKK